MQDRDAVAEAGAHPADGLRCERDLRNEDDRAEPALERRGARLQVHLGLAGAGRAVDEEVAAVTGVHRLDDPRHGGDLLGRERERLGFAAERLPLGRRRLLLATLRQLRGDERERPSGRRAVVVGDPERERDERRRHLADHAVDRTSLDPFGSRVDAAQSTIPRARERPNGMRTIAPTPTPSSTSYVNSRATARAVTSG